MKTYVISLKERQDRRDRFHLPFEYEFLIQERLTGVVGIDWSLGNLGCMLGHRQAVELAKQQGLNEVLVLEDDADIKSELPKKFPFPLTFLGGDFTEGSQELHNERFTNIVGSHAVYYHKSTFDYLLQTLPSLAQLRELKDPFMLEPYDIWLSKNGVGYLNIFESNDEENSDIPHGKKIKTKLLTK